MTRGAHDSVMRMFVSLGPRVWLFVNCPKDFPFNSHNFVLRGQFHICDVYVTDVGERNFK
jgi:hypothetical protein